MENPGRKRDSWHRPRRTRRRFKVSFHLRGGVIQGANVAVEGPDFEAKLKKYRDEVIAVNPEWFRPRTQKIVLGIKNGKEVVQYAPVLDKAGKQIIDSMLLKVTAEPLGADI